jgi:hypothetical protein
MTAAAGTLDPPQAAPPDSEFYEVTETPTSDGRAILCVPQADGCGE